VNQLAVRWRVFQQVHHSVVLHRQRVRDLAPDTVRQELPQIVIVTQRSMGIMVAPGQATKTTIEIGDEGGRISVGCLSRADAPYTEFLDQPVL